MTLVLILFLSALASLMYGAVTINPGRALQALIEQSDPIVWGIRAPRVLSAALVGASLAVAGALLQGVTRNPLADPTILGITAAAGLASAAMITAEPQSPRWIIAVASVAGALVGGAVLFVIAWRGTISPVRLALAGVAVSAFFGAAIVGLLSTSRTFLQTSLGFLAGGLYGADWTDVRATIGWSTVGLIAALLLSGRLNILALGDDVAASLGVLTDRTRMAVLATCALLTGAAVATAGLVSFVGLVCPHLARSITGPDHRAVVPLSALTGAALVVVADLVAKLVIRPSEIPMGILTAAVGAPFLLYILKFRS